MKFTTWLYITIGFLASLGFLAVSAFMNFKYGLTLGNTPENAWMYGGFSILTDIFKTLLPLFIVSFFLQRQYISVAVGSTIFGLLVIYSLLSAFGFAKTNRATLSKEALTQERDLKTWRSDLKSAKSEKKALPKYRPVQTVKSALNAAKQNRRWQTTKNCLEGEVTARKSRAFCSDYNTLLGELATSQEAQKLNLKIDKIERKINRVATGETQKIGDVQAEALVSFAGLSEDNAQSVLSGFIAVLTELCSSFGLVLTTVFWRNHNNEAQKKKPIKKVSVKKDVSPRIPHKNKGSSDRKVTKSPPINKISKPKITTQKETPKIPDNEPLKSDDKIIVKAANDIKGSDDELSLVDFMNLHLERNQSGSVFHDRLYSDFKKWCLGCNCVSLNEMDFIEQVQAILQSRPINGYYEGYSLIV